MRRTAGGWRRVAAGGGAVAGGWQQWAAGGRGPAGVHRVALARNGWRRAGGGGWRPATLRLLAGVCGRVAAGGG